MYTAGLYKRILSLHRLSSPATPYRIPISINYIGCHTMHYALALFALIPAALHGVMIAVAQTTGTSSSASSVGSGAPDAYDVSCLVPGAPMYCFVYPCKCSGIGVFGCSDKGEQTTCKYTYMCGCVKYVSTI